MSNVQTTALRTKQQLTKTALAAALKAHSNVTLAEIAAIPTAAASSKVYQLPLVCQFTGVTCGSLTLATTAGYLPLLGQWKQQQVLHPLFSLEQTALLNVAKNNWIRFCGFSSEEAADATLTDKQEKLLQIAAVAMLHHLAPIKQDVPWLPSFTEVQNCWQSLLGLSYWKAYLDSKRFSFPALRISKHNPAPILKDYLQTCWEHKKSYEREVRDLADQAAAQAAEDALLSIRDELAGKRPTSTKLLWKWFLANLPARYSRDADGWMWELFTAKDTAIFEFTMADVDLFEEIFLCECPTGSSISYAFLEVLRSKRKLLENHFEAFEILVPAAMQLEAAAGVIPAAEPKQADFTTKVQFIIAHAKWRLTHGASANSNVHRDAAAAKQLQTTVTPSFRPVLDHGRSRDSKEELVVGEPDDFETDVDAELAAIEALEAANAEAREELEQQANLGEL